MRTLRFGTLPKLECRVGGSRFRPRQDEQNTYFNFAHSSLRKTNNNNMLFARSHTWLFFARQQKSIEIELKTYIRVCVSRHVGINGYVLGRKIECRCVNGESAVRAIGKWIKVHQVRCFIPSASH
jgi:hypothetical protein